MPEEESGVVLAVVQWYSMQPLPAKGASFESVSLPPSYQPRSASF